MLCIHIPNHLFISIAKLRSDSRKTDFLCHTRTLFFCTREWRSKNNATGKLYKERDFVETRKSYLDGPLLTARRTEKKELKL